MAVTTETQVCGVARHSSPNRSASALREGRNSGLASRLNSCGGRAGAGEKGVGLGAAVASDTMGLQQGRHSQDNSPCSQSQQPDSNHRKLRSWPPGQPASPSPCRPACPPAPAWAGRRGGACRPPAPASPPGSAAHAARGCWPARQTSGWCPAARKGPAHHALKPQQCFTTYISGPEPIPVVQSLQLLQECNPSPGALSHHSKGR